VVLLIRGTCQQFKFKMPYDVDDIKAARIKFWQPCNENMSPIIKTLDMCVPDAKTNSIVVTLNQEETLTFADDLRAFVQFRGLTSDNFAFGSRRIPINVYPTADETILEAHEDESVSE
jgi:hypothetical protein